jgi:RNA polymerase sigma-70 factor (ECF subfamily)
LYTEKEFIAAIENNQGILHKVCNLYMETPHDKEDLFQEILLQAWRGIKNYKGDAKFSTWLYRVALNTAITFYRKDQRQVTTTELKEQLAGVAYTAYNDDEMVTALYKVIGELSNIDKALVMLYLEDYSYQEIGDMMGITANNVAVKMNRVKTKLKENSKKYL